MSLESAAAALHSLISSASNLDSIPDSQYQTQTLTLSQSESHSNSLTMSEPKKRKLRCQIDTKDAQMIVDMHFMKGFSYGYISTEIYSGRISKATVARICAEYNEAGYIDKMSRFDSEKKKKTGRKPKLNEEEYKIIEEIQENHNEFTLRQIRERFESITGKSPSCPMISKILKKQNFTTKKLEIEPSERNTLRVKEIRKEYCMQMNHVDSKDLIFLDEKPWNLHQIRSRGRSKLGTPALCLVPKQRGPNVSFIAAMSIEFGLIHSITHVGGVNATVYSAFLQGLFAHPILQSRSFYIVHDNVNFHHSPTTADTFHGNPVSHTQIFLPPYSPHLNPIETMFSKFSWKVKELNPQTPARLIEVLKELTNDGNFVTIQNCSSWMDKCKGYYVDCVAMKDLI